MNIEVGKFYRTRDGRKAIVYSFYGEKGSQNEDHGAVKNITAIFGFFDAG